MLPLPPPLHTPGLVTFWRLQVIDNYNGSMGWVDVADQLRNYYRQDKNMRNRKYWWPIYQWASGVMATNAFIIYQRVCDKRKVHLRSECHT